MHITLALLLLLAAFVLFVVDTVRTRSLTSAGLACLTASFLVAGVS
jgi:hypothetical protein